MASIVSSPVTNLIANKAGSITSSLVSSFLPNSSLALTLDSVTFQGFELPERFGPLGGTQVMETHDFPGGIRSIQTYGAFPDVISWKGIMTGTSALDRAQIVDRIRIVGNQVKLSYERWAYTGTVQHFHANVRQQWYVPYDISFMPIKDISSGVNSGFGVNSDELNLLNQINTLSGLYGGGSLPPALLVPVAGVVSSATTALTNGNGIVANISVSDVTSVVSAVSSLASLAGAYIAQSNPLTSSPASDAMNHAQNIQNIVQSPGKAYYLVHVINPNLYTLAAQYLGSASNWRSIATLNNINDPLPTGVFNLQIPKVA